MSLSLDRGTVPKGLIIKTWGPGNDVVFLGDYEISMEDFLVAAYYVLTNTNLKDKDPRLQFVECVRSMRETKGYFSSVERDSRRLISDIPPVP